MSDILGKRRGQQETRAISCGCLGWWDGKDMRLDMCCNNNDDGGNDVGRNDFVKGDSRQENVLSSVCKS